jgi:hypothetical protein
VAAARPPVAPLPHGRPSPLGEGRTGGFRGGPELSTLEPPQLDIRLCALELPERREQILGLPGTEGRRLRSGDDHPAREGLGHYCRSSRFSFSMSVVL